MVVVGGGPGGYEAALVAAALGAYVSVVEQDGMGGAAVLTDCVPSKALIATGGYLGRLVASAARMGIYYRPDHDGDPATGIRATIAPPTAGRSSRRATR